MAPKTLPNNPKGRGVLPVSVAATKKPFKQTPRAPAPRLRLIVRRLPPGLTEGEFWTCLGREWHVGQGKLDWAAYKPGKLSKDLAKPSRPSRAYLKAKDTSHIEVLSIHIKTINFQDAKNSYRDPCLIGLPSLEFAAYNKIPSGRARHDGRQGTIDQDPEFIDFLQSLTEPITKAAANGDANAKQEKVTITPLVQFIKDKKANKAKEKEAAAAAVKAGKKVESKDVKGASPSKSEQQPVIKKVTTSEAEKARVAKATQDVVKAINTLSKSAVAQQSKTVPAKPEPPAKEPTTPTQSAPKRERQRGDANAAARIISRDLGLTPKEGRSTRNPRAASASSSNASASTPAPPSPKAVPTPVLTAPTAPTAQPQPQPPTGPRNLRNTTPQPSPLRPSPIPQPQPSASKPNAKQLSQPAPGAKSAFLKHANPSQGVTEELLRTTFSTYGAITRCEIDKKKGLGYLDFVDTEGLKKAMAASPVKIANGSVVVLENRSPYRKASSVTQAKGSNAAASTSTSVASSPKVTQAGLASIFESKTAQPKSEIATSDIVVKPAPKPATPDVVTVPADSAVSTETPASPTAVITAAAAKGAAGGRGGRGHFRGRGGSRGRGGNRGGNRAASTPAGAGISAPPTPATKGGENK